MDFLQPTNRFPFTLQELIGKYTLLSNAPTLTRSRKDAATTIMNALKQAQSIHVVAQYIETCAVQDRKIARSLTLVASHMARERLAIYEAFLREVGMQDERR